MAKYDNLSLQEKIDTRENLITQMRALNDSCKNESGEIRSFTAEETNKYNGMAEDVRTLAALIASEKRSNDINGFASSVPVSGKDEKRETSEMEEFRTYLRTGRMSDGLENRTLNVDGVGNTAGALAPQEFVKQIIANAQEEVKLLNRVNIIHLNQVASIGVPTESADASDAAWTTEEPVSVTADSAWAFGKRELGAIQLIKLVKVTKKLLKTSAFDVNQLVSSKLSLKLNQAFEKAIVVGSGSGQPLGVFTASNDGVSTARDVTAKGATYFTADDVIKLKRNCKQQYRSKGVYVANPSIITDVVLMKDNNGQYIWRSGLTANDPDRLYGSEVIESSYAPSTKTAGLYTMVFGDFSNYWMTLVDQIGIQVLVEKYAEAGCIGYLATAFADGAPVLAEAFSRLKMAATDPA